MRLQNAREKHGPKDHGDHRTLYIVSIRSIGFILGSFFSILPLIGEFNDRSRLTDILGSAEGRFQNLHLILHVEWFPCGMAEGIVDKERPRRLNECGKVKG